MIDKTDTQMRFLDTLTMAEIALFGQSTGVQLTDLDKANPMELMPALAVIALQRLGVETSRETAANLTVQELEDILSAASNATPTRPDEINKILETVRGKSRKSSGKRSEQ